MDVTNIRVGTAFVTDKYYILVICIYWISFGQQEKKYQQCN